MLAHFAPTEAWQFCEGQVRARAADMQQSLWCTNPRLFHTDPEGTSVPSARRATAHRQGHQGAGAALVGLSQRELLHSTAWAQEASFCSKVEDLESPRMSEMVRNCFRVQKLDSSRRLSSSRLL